MKFVFALLTVFSVSAYAQQCDVRLFDAESPEAFNQTSKPFIQQALEARGYQLVGEDASSFISVWGEMNCNGAKRCEVGVNFAVEGEFSLVSKSFKGPSDGLSKLGQVLAKLPTCAQLLKRD